MLFAPPLTVRQVDASDRLWSLCHKTQASVLPGQAKLVENQTPQAPDLCRCDLRKQRGS